MTRQPLKLSDFSNWKCWCPDNFQAARKAANAHGFLFFPRNADQSAYDKCAKALYGDPGQSLSYSGPDKSFFEEYDAVEIFFQDGEFYAEAQTPAVQQVQSRRAWLQARLSIIAEAIKAKADADENVDFEWERELGDLISQVRRLPKD